MLPCTFLFASLLVGQVSPQIPLPPALAQSPAPSFGAASSYLPPSQPSGPALGPPAGSQAAAPFASAAPNNGAVGQAAAANPGPPASPQASAPLVAWSSVAWTPNSTQAPNNGSAAAPCDACPSEQRGFWCRFFKAEIDEYYKKDEDSQTAPPARRNIPPEPWSSPPFPGHEYQGYPLMGVPYVPTTYPLMKAMEGTCCGDALACSKIAVDGWVTASGNYSNCKNANTPSSYWIVPNRPELDQAVLRIHKEVDSVQTDHIDWGFRSILLYGMDYRYTTAGGWFSNQLLEHNLQNGFDPVEQYLDIYIPWVTDGLTVRIGRWIACPDIETQYSVDNYLGSHSILFTFDTYTQTGIMFSFKMDYQNMLQCAIQAGTDMAPWYKGATPTGFFGWRWVSMDNNDSFYTCLNNINNAQFRHFNEDGQPAGHDNFNYIVSTWSHRFNDKVHTSTEGYFMWQFNAVVGGTPSIGPPRSFGGGGGIGAPIPGTSIDYGILNYTMFQTSKRDYITVRNEIWNDPQGERTGFASLYSSHTIGISHQFNDVFMVRPEMGYYHSYNGAAFDLGAKSNMFMIGFDSTMRF